MKADLPGERFWEKKPLASLSKEEWESLCDGCGRCCLNKLEDEDDGGVVFTRLACHLLDIEHCRCSDYEGRQVKVPTCLDLRSIGWNSIGCLSPVPTAWWQMGNRCSTGTL